MAPTPAPITAEGLVSKYFPASQYNNALCIISKESGYRSWASNTNTNGSVDRGLFQINSVHAGRVNGNVSSLFDPETNVRVASQIWGEQGWHPWATHSKCGL